MLFNLNHVVKYRIILGGQATGSPLAATHSRGMVGRSFQECRWDMVSLVEPGELALSATFPNASNKWSHDVAQSHQARRGL